MTDTLETLKVDMHKLEERLSSDIKENRRRIQENSGDISELKVLYKTLSNLPNTMASLDKTIDKVCLRLDSMETSLKSINESVNVALSKNSKQDEEIKRIDDKSKIDWAKAITENFWKIILAVGVVYYVAKDLIH